MIPSAAALEAFHIYHCTRVRTVCLNTLPTVIVCPLGLREYALIAALKDTRFDPIGRKELKELKCSVSLLTNFESANGHLDWEIGKHGIQIDFDHPTSAAGSRRDDSIRRGDYSATFLPEVASEQEWDHLETIMNLIRKSGYRGRIDETLLLSLRVTRYQSVKCTVDFQQFWQWKAANQNSNLMK